MTKPTLLSTFWIFLVANFMFCDIFTLMHAPDLQNILDGKAGEMEMTQEFLLGFAFMMEIPMVMILLSRLLKRKSNRIANLIAAILLGFIQSWSLTVGDTTLHYWFFSLIEIATCLAIIVVAWNWKEDKLQNESLRGKVPIN